MEKIYILLNNCQNDIFFKNYELLKNFSKLNYFNYEYVICILEENKINNHFSNSYYSINDIIKSASFNNANYLINIDKDFKITQDIFSNFLEKIILNNHEVSIITNHMSSFRIKFADYTLSENFQNSMIYVGFVPTCSGFKKNKVTHNELPSKILLD